MSAFFGGIMRVFFFLIGLIYTSFTFSGDLSLPFLMRSSSDDFTSPSLYPVASDCLKRPPRNGVGFALTNVNGVYFDYSGKCFWEAVNPGEPEAYNGYIYVVADWYPRMSIPMNVDEQGELCRQKPVLEGAEFSHAWKARDPNDETYAYYANYQGCHYYSPCPYSGCESPYIGDYYPIGEAEPDHKESQLVQHEVEQPKPVEPEFIQPAPPPEMKEGEYVINEVAYEYYKKVFRAYCDFMRENTSGLLCYLSNIHDNPAQKLLKDAKPQPPYDKSYYDCYIKDLKYPELGNNVCYLKEGHYTDGRTVYECTPFSTDPRCRRGGGNGGNTGGGSGGNTGGGNGGNTGGNGGSSQELKDIRNSVMNVDNNTSNMIEYLDSIDGNTHSTNKNILASNTQLKKLNSTTEQILKTLKNNNSGNTGSGGNYHGDIEKLNNDMNQNHEALMTALGGTGEGEPDLSGLEGQYNASADEYGQSSLTAIGDFMSGLFDDIPDFNVTFELPPEFYGRSQRSIGSCIPYKKQLKIALPYGYSYDIKLDFTTMCDYYDGYFRGVATFILYFMTALACYRLYNRFMLSRF